MAEHAGQGGPAHAAPILQTALMSDLPVLPPMAVQMQAPLASSEVQFPGLTDFLSGMPHIPAGPASNPGVGGSFAPQWFVLHLSAVSTLTDS